MISVSGTISNLNPRCVVIYFGMEITVKNFEKCLPEIEKAIDSADFISIDGELTGLQNGADFTAYDTPFEYYTKCRKNTSNFLLIQVGISTFRYDIQENKYFHRDFNFYIFPKSYARKNDFNFSCQVSCINFLSRMGFDFNKLFKLGIPYLSVADKKTLQEELLAKYNSKCDEESLPKIPIPSKFALKVEQLCNKIEKFLFSDTKETELIITEPNGFIRRLILQMEPDTFSNQEYNLFSRVINNMPCLIVQKGRKKSKAEIDEENYENEKKDIENLFGFSKIFIRISEQKKIIIGHNMLMDICHIINAFFYPLPENFSDFKDIVHKTFPRIIDTKYMCHALPFKNIIRSSVVQHMIEQLHEPPFTFPVAKAENEEYCYSENDDKSHEAGYDAYITGLAFIALASYLNKDEEQQSHVELNFDLIKIYENRIHIMRVMDYSCINLVELEPVPNRNHVFHITFPKTWKTLDIIKLFNSYGGAIVSYNNQTSAWITLQNPDQAEEAVGNLIDTRNNNKEYTLVTWNTYVNANSNSQVVSRLYNALNYNKCSVM